MATSPQTRLSPPISGPTSESRQNLRVLVIDDAEAIHEDFRKILIQKNTSATDEPEVELFGPSPSPVRRVYFTVDSAHQGEDGLGMVQRARAEGRPYAVAFVDVRMPPGWDGIETTSKLWEADPDLQVVLCTAYSDYSWDEMTERVGASDNLLILKKPFDTVEVLQLAHALSKKWLLTQESNSRLEDLDRLVQDRTGELRASNERLGNEVAEHARTEEALRAAQTRLSYLLTQSPAVLFSLKTDAHTHAATWASDSIFQMTGYTAAEACQPDWWANHVHPGDWDEATAAKTQLAVEGKSAVEYRIRHKNGQYRWIREEQKLTGDHASQPTEIVGTWMEITERKELEEKFRQAQKMEAVGQLAGGVAHDFNNLLLVMSGHAELLLLRAEEYGPQAADSLKQITSASKRAANLTRQLLAFSRKQVMQSQPLSLNDLIANLTRMLKRIIGEDIQLQCQSAPQLSYVDADAGMLEQTLVNLVVNARDAMPNGGRLLVSTENVVIDKAYARANRDAAAGSFVCLSVTDTGTGIAAAHLPHIFEPFFTTKEVGKGTGLGLATVYGIVKQHHGWVEVSSQVGAGTTFKLFLPVTSTPPGDETAPVVQKEIPRGTETVLLVEDDDAVRSLTRRLLENFGYSVREEVSGREALSRWASQTANVDLLLTDVVMPQGVSGIELADKLRASRPSLRVVFMSGYPAQAAGKETDFFRRPRTRFLPKPCPWRDLLHTVRQCLDEA